MENINYISTRNADEIVSPSKAILKGISKDGGLFVPSSIPKIDFDIKNILNMSYREMAYEIIKLFLTDFTENELKYCIDNAYDSKFDTDIIAPIVKKDDIYFLELFHGRTLAFKDIALSILPYLLKTAAKKNGMDSQIVILTATSGDTGKAALEGFANVDGTKIIVFFPENGVSDVQKYHMVTQQGNNVHVVGIDGNFDDAQTGVKQIFTDIEFADELKKNGFVFSSANSINIGRLVPQIVYYFYSYSQIVNMGDIKFGEKINFTVPTGNFGNILAGYYAKQMGLPINKLICASNDNKVLYDFFRTGIYDKNREFVVTVSPSMDILVSSNLERLLYHICSSQSKTDELMKKLKDTGRYEFKIDTDEFYGEYATEAETFKSINDVYRDCNYIMDTHTAVAYASYKKYLKSENDNSKTVIVSTASPYKFAKDIVSAIDSKYKTKTPFEALDVLAEIESSNIPNQIKDLNKKEILHKTVCDKDKMADTVKEFLGLNL